MIEHRINDVQGAQGQVINAYNVRISIRLNECKLADR